MRNDESFRQFYTLTVEEAKDCTEEPLLPQYRRPPKKIDEGEMPHSFKSAEDMIKMHYFSCTLFTIIINILIFLG